MLVVGGLGLSPANAGEQSAPSSRQTAAILSTLPTKKRFELWADVRIGRVILISFLAPHLQTVSLSGSRVEDTKAIANAEYMPLDLEGKRVTMQSKKP
jgi:hypothetical protein